MDAATMIINALGGLALFLFGMRVMSDGLQKVAGPRMRSVLGKMTGNRFSGMLTGIGVTCAVQSSSATTVMLVSFVSAGLISLSQSIGVVMGANIGTTFTGWLVALLGFKFKIVTLAFPAIFFGFMPRVFGARRLAEWGEVLLGFGVLFLGLDFMKEAVEGLRDSPAILAFMRNADASDIPVRLASVAIGAVFTMMVQSSSATMAITLTLAAQGIIDVPTACALVLGENIGTTITANLAALSASRTAKRTARAHFVFNFFGALWGTILFMPFLQLVNMLVPGDVLTPGVSQAVLASHVAMFHTLFNVLNTALFLPFVPQLAWIASKLVPGVDTEPEMRLRYLHPHLMESPPMALHATRQEFERMVNEVETMLDKVVQLIHSPTKKMGKVAESISASEDVVDYLEKEITEYLVAITRVETSIEQSAEIAGFLGAVSDVERMGDHCEMLHRLLAKRYDKKIEFTDLAKSELMEIAGKVKELMQLLKTNMEQPRDAFMKDANTIEAAINDMRKNMRKGHVKRLNSGTCSVSSGLLFIDMLTSFEKMGDHGFNVAQMLAGER